MRRLKHGIIGIMLFWPVETYTQERSCPDTNTSENQCTTEPIGACEAQRDSCKGSEFICGAMHMKCMQRVLDVCEATAREVREACLNAAPESESGSLE